MTADYLVVAESPAATSVGGLLAMMAMGVLLSLWPLAVFTNFRGYRDAHARRALAAARTYKSLAPWGGRSHDAERKFVGIMQFIVAIAFVVVGAALLSSGLVGLVRRIL